MHQRAVFPDRMNRDQGTPPSSLHKPRKKMGEKNERQGDALVLPARRSVNSKSVSEAPQASGMG
jgi:hypothetical protein